jgi:hypothetical protein
MNMENTFVVLARARFSTNLALPYLSVFIGVYLRLPKREANE